MLYMRAFFTLIVLRLLQVEIRILKAQHTERGRHFLLEYQSEYKPLIGGASSREIVKLNAGLIAFSGFR